VKTRIAFDLDYTLGAVIVHPLSSSVIGILLRPGARKYGVPLVSLKGWNKRAQGIALGSAQP